MMTLFYIGLNPRWQSYSWLPRSTNVMFSAAGFWDDGWRRGCKFFTTGLKFLDSGGFTMLNRYGEFPFGIDEYSNLVAHLKPDYYASMDYPCEPDISRGLLTTNRERIDKTVENTKLLTEWEGHLRSQLIPVIQGYTLDEYKYCIDEYHRIDMIRDYMAVGSMCRRINTDELTMLIVGIGEYAKSAGITKLHWFGLKLDPRLIGLSEYIYSRDSAVGLDAYDKNIRASRGGRRWPRGQEEKRQAFESFFDRLNNLGLRWYR